VNLLLTPIARGLETLEGQNTTCSDVFHVYTGIAVNLTTMFSDRSGFYFPISCALFLIVHESDSTVYEYRKAIFDVFNRRFNNFMNDCTPGMFILSYLLDPGKHSSSSS
jgi:hypothetical protein